jgi:hypothetical protein
VKYRVYRCSVVIGILLVLFLPYTTHAQEPERLRVTGYVEQGTHDGTPLPAGMALELVISTPEEGIKERFQTVTNADGTFVFENIPHLDNHLYTVAAQYQGLPQISEPRLVDALDEPIVLSLYETTTVINAAQIQITQGIMIIDFTDVQKVGLEVLLSFTITNVSDRILYGQDLMYFELPVGAYGIAQAINADNPTQSANLLEIEEGTIPIVRETAPIFPLAPHEISISYLIPYTAGAIIDQVFPMDIANFSVWLPIDTVSLTAENFTKAEENIESGGLTYQHYYLTAPIQVDENGDAKLIFSLGGAPTETTRTARELSRKEKEDKGFSLVLPAIAGGLLLIAGIAFWLWGRRETPDLE